VFWYDALLEAGASRVASFLYFEPIVTVAWPPRGSASA